MTDRGGARQGSDVFAPPGVEWSRVSDRLIVARYVTAGVPLALLVVVGVVVGVLTGSAWAWAATAVVVLVAVWVAWLVPRQVRAVGYAERDDDLLIRHGILVRRLVVVPYGRMQYLDVQRGPLLRALGLASLQLHTASPGTDASIDGLTADVAEGLRDHLAARGEARLAGL
ncbi:PH domain-containing protein [Luteimicrobium subarcticum]|uniref:YdbS-like PH domain-containing protein n=1 Tax=Luteimicrobium subarcticum TaxID=620910 RepID=A0A2M8WSL9_9MICO|nr:PH domain-containing protein [Luteimicrobium subarcticum]PJI93945.1 hypothetical protein CLV34_1426 [Luteimicrobium subarcticum]